MVSLSRVPGRSFLLLLLCCWSASAIAHNPGISNAEILIDDDHTVEVSLAFKGIDIEKAIGAVFVDQKIDRVRAPELALAGGAIHIDRWVGLHAGDLSWA